MRHSEENMENMDSLISSIRQQAIRLRENLAGNKKEQKNSRSKSLAKSDFNFLNQDEEKKIEIRTLPPQAPHSPSKKSNDELIDENLNLLEIISEFRDGLDKINKKNTELERELDLEKMKSIQKTFLETRVNEERAKSQHFRLENIQIKATYMNLLEIIRQTAFEISEQDKEEMSNMEHLHLENAHLRDLLQISRLYDDQVDQIDMGLTQEEQELQEGNMQEYKATLQMYLKSKQESTQKFNPGQPVLTVEDAPVTEEYSDPEEPKYLSSV